MRYNEYDVLDKRNKPLVKIFHSTVEGGKRAYRGHHHTECELSTIISGCGTYSLENKEYDVKKGDVILFGSDETHCLTEISTDERFDLLNIQFEPRILWTNTEFHGNLMQIFLERNKNFENRINRNNPTSNALKRLIFEIEDEMANDRFNRSFIVQSKLFEILTLIIRDYDYVSPRETNSAVLSQLRLTLEYIDENLSEPLTLDELSKKATMNKTYFCTVFKRYNGISPWEYISIKRVEKAIELIKTTSLTKLEIAGQCGFNSASNFYKIFGEVTGKTPSDYKKQTE